jgi:hypothetical protein
MQHSRNDSAMTHSSRKSYKEKYEQLKANIPNTQGEAQKLSDLAEYKAVQEHARVEQHKLLCEMAEYATELVEVLDSRNGQLGFNVKDIRKPIDTNLNQMDGNLIARRTRDVLKHAIARVAMAGYGMTELRDSIVTLQTGVQLLQPVVEQSYAGYMESYIVGAHPTSREIEEATQEKGKNPRTLGYTYDTDDDDSEDEAVSVQIPKETSLVVQRSGKPTSPGREHAKAKNNNEISIN